MFNVLGAINVGLVWVSFFCYLEHHIEVDTAMGVAGARTKPTRNRNVGIRLFNDDSDLK